MKKYTVEADFKKKLESRNIKPSKKVWKQLDAQLTDERPQGKRSFVYWYSIASLFIVLLGLSFYFNQLAQRTDTIIQPSVVIQPLPKLEKPPLNKIVPEKKRIAQIPLRLSFKSKDVVLGNIADIPLTTSIEIKQLSITNKNSAYRDSLLQLETDALLEIAYQNLKTAKIKDASKKRKALELLLAVEEELYSEIQLKSKIIDFIQNSYSKATLASNETNP